MVATFCLRAAASRREARTSACGAAASSQRPHRPVRIVRPRGCATPLFYRCFPLLRLQLLLAIGLPRPCDQLELTPFHVLFEHAELRLLTDVEHLIDGVVRLADFAVRPRLELIERLQAILDLRLVRLRIVHKTPQLL